MINSKSLTFSFPFLFVIFYFYSGITQIALSAEPETETQTTYAIIIGIANYEKVKNLEFSDKDAQAFAGFLNSQSGGSVNPNHIKVFINEEATATQIGDAFTWLLKSVKAHDRVYFFFAGHGDMESLINIDNGLLLLHKAPKESYIALGQDFLPVAYLRKVIEELANKNVEAIAIIDACHSGNLAGGEAGQYSTAVQLTGAWENSTKLLSCHPDELSHEGPQWGGGHGVFSYHLVLGMGGLADADKDNIVTLQELRNYLETVVPKETAPSYQTPMAIGNLKKALTRIDPQELAEMRNAYEKQVKTFSYVNTLSSDDIFMEYLESQDDTLKALYSKYLHFIGTGHLIEPPEKSAFQYFKLLREEIESDILARLLERNFIAALQEKAMDIIIPILDLKRFDKTIPEVDLAGKELELAIQLLGEDHYLYGSMMIRQSFLEAYSLCLQYRIDGDTLKLTNAEDKLASALLIDEYAAYPYFQLGWIYINKGEYEKAKSSYKYYQLLVPNNPRAYNNLGVAYNYLEQFDSAIINFQKIIELDSGFVRAYNNIGYAYAFQNKFPESEKWFKIVVEKDSSHFEGWYNLGLVNIKLHDFTEAESYFFRALELSPDHPDVLYNLACLYSITNETEKALNYLNLSLKAGYRDINKIKTDPDLNNIRMTEEFNRILESL